LLLVLFKHGVVETHVFYIHVVETFLAGSHSALDQSDLASFDLFMNHIAQAFSAEEVFAAGEESELITKEATRANIASVLF